MKHERNVDGLRQNAQKKRQKAIERTEQGIKQLLKEGRSVNFKTVSEIAEVSTAWLYREPDIKERIEQLRMQGTEKKLPAAKQRASDASKDSMLKTHKERIRRLEAEIRGLRSHIEVISGLNVRLDAENESLKKQLAVLQASQPLIKASQSLSATSKVIDAEISKNLRSELTTLGVEINSTLVKAMSQVSEEVVWLTIAALKEQKAIRPVPNPTGFLVEGIKASDWHPNQQYQEKTERDAFKQWFDLARSLNIVKASEKKSDGVQYVYTSDGDWVPFSEISAEHPLESLREMV